MQITETSRDARRENRIVTAMITDDAVLGRLAAVWDRDNPPLLSKWAQAVASLCVDYHSQYGKAPNGTLPALFAEWAGRHPDPDSVAQAEKFLVQLNQNRPRTGDNPDYLVDLAGRHFNTVRLTQMTERVTAFLAAGDVEKAMAEADALRKVELGKGAGVDLFLDEESVGACFGKGKEPVIVYPGALGEFFQDTLARGEFVAFMGPDKVGKTRWLIDLAFVAMVQRRRVAFFEAGDMGARQVYTRFLVRASGHPSRAPDWPCTVNYPTAVVHHFDEDTGDKDDPADVTWEEKTFAAPLSKEKAWKVCQKVMRSRVRSEESYFKIACYPTGTLAVKGMHAVLESWERQYGWTPDVVVVDYADILAPPGGKNMERRDAINATWEQLRGLTQEWQALGVTATQSDASAYDKKLIDRRNFSEDKRKNAHVTGMVGLNVTAEEKRRGVTRLNWVLAREIDFNTQRPVHVAGCPALCMPAVKSCWPGGSSERP